MNHSLAEKPRPSSFRKSSLKLKMLKTKVLAKQIEKKRLVRLGDLIAQAKLDHLDTQTLYGALITIKEMTELRSNLNLWKRIGKEHFVEEEQ
jgi:hypothetical protein